MYEWMNVSVQMYTSMKLWNMNVCIYRAYVCMIVCCFALIYSALKPGKSIWQIGHESFSTSALYQATCPETMAKKYTVYSLRLHLKEMWMSLGGGGKGEGESRLLELGEGAQGHRGPIWPLTVSDGQTWFHFVICHFVWHKTWFFYRNSILKGPKWSTKYKV